MPILRGRSASISRRRLRISRAEHHIRYLESDCDTDNAKKDIIRRILSEGKQVLIKKVAEFTAEQDAYIYEWALICLYAETVTNMRIGKGRVRKIQLFNKNVRHRFTLWLF